ncbi:MAG: S-layer homology domain-containing protein [Oscillospiraceae bacterium]|nr:S-layer homology domain-containing protein [Oscillospiraceae bacterium]
MTVKHGRPAALWIAALGLILALTLPAAPALADESGSQPALETEEHIRYINGMGEGLFVPDGSLTRAEAATMIYNLLTDTTPGDYDSGFTDVSAGAWFMMRCPPWPLIRFCGAMRTAPSAPTEPSPGRNSSPCWCG